MASGTWTAVDRIEFGERSQQHLAHPFGGPSVEVVGGEDPVDHVALDLGGLAAREPDRDDRPTGKPADRAVGIAPARRAPERRDDQTRCPRRALELPSTLCEQDRPGPHLVTMAGG